MPNSLKMSSPERKQEELYSPFNSPGIQAELAQPGRPEEMFRGVREEPRGLVYIRDQTLE